MKYHINEIFYSIQGEGFNVGIPAVFIRFSGCNRKCSFCDTDFSLHLIVSISMILKQIKNFKCKTVILTGGEPSLQPVKALIKALKNKDYFVCVETNGYNIDEISRASFVTYSPKDTIDMPSDVYHDELKIVYTGQDLKPYKKYMKGEGYNFLQPCDVNGQMNIKETVEYIKKNPEWRLSLQCQKLISIK